MKDCCEDKSPRSGDSSTPKSRTSVGAPEEIIVSIDLNKAVNRMHILACTGALDFLFSLGFQWNEESNELLFATSDLEKQWETRGNMELPLPVYMKFEAEQYLAELDAAAAWHKARVGFLNQKFRSKLTQPAYHKDMSADEKKARKESIETSEKKMQSMFDALDEDLKTACNYSVEEILRAKNLLCDERNESNVEFEVDYNTKRLRRNQKNIEKMLNY